NLTLVERLRQVGEKYHRPPGQVAVAWVLRNPAVTAAIVGARNAHQVEKNVGAAELQLTEEEVAEIGGGKVQEPEPVMAGRILNSIYNKPAVLPVVAPS